MAQTIAPGPVGDTPKVIEDKVRALPANQGLNEADMWTKINTEITAASTASKLIPVEIYPAAATNNKHGKK